ncbi:MAG: hypothetical protein LJU34_09160 [Oscillospiraceae bacterium]|nr:hypothetical protein [Oscillospiraceae bacterium]
MAERRMFARSIISSSRFLSLSRAARLLYYDLGMAADNDGCVEALGVMRMTGAPSKALAELEEMQFITPLYPGKVYYICEWHRNNQIRPDRYREGLYKSKIPSV